MTIQEPLEICLESFIPANLHHLRSPGYKESTNITINGSLGKISVSSNHGISRTVHTFTVEAQDFGYTHYSAMENVQDLLAICCTLNTATIVFTPTHIDRLSWKVCQSLLQKEGFAGLTNVTCTTPITLDEANILSTAQKLIGHGFGGLLSNNLLEAVDCFRLALNSSNPTAMFSHLYACNDKLANSNQNPQLRAHRLDQEIARLGAITVQEAADFRICANRFKHPATTPITLQDLADCRNKLFSQLPKLIDLTKQLLVPAI